MSAAASKRDRNGIAAAAAWPWYPEPSRRSWCLGAPTASASSIATSAARAASPGSKPIPRSATTDKPASSSARHSDSIARAVLHTALGGDAKEMGGMAPGTRRAALASLFKEHFRRGSVTMSRFASRAILFASCIVALALAACSAGSPASSPTSPPGVAQAKPTTAPAAAPTAQPAAAAKPAATSAPANAGVAQAQPTPTAADTSSDTLLLGQQLSRMVIYTTEIGVLVVDLDRLPDELGRLAQTQGGYVSGVETRTENNVPAVTVRLKVPPERYPATMNAIRDLAVEVRSEKATTQDVTEEYSDTQAQITSLEATHAQLLELMKRAGSVEELLKVQQQASQVRLQIDRLKGRATALERLSALASISVLAQPAGVVIERDFTTSLATVGQAERAVQRERGRLSTLDQLATRLSIVLPTPDEAAAATASDEALPATYLQTRVDLKRAQADQQRATVELEAGARDASVTRLQEAILRTTDLTVRLKVLQDRAGQIGVTLPAVSAQEEAVMASVSGPSFDALLELRRAWTTSLNLLVQVGSGLLVVWWLLLPLGVAAVLLMRRSGRAPRTT